MGKPAKTLTPCLHCGEVHPPTVLKCPKADTVLDLTGRVLDGRFRLLRELGKGGMATVWCAHNIRVDRMVAIKLIRPDLVKTPETLARFRDEARAAGKIGNAQICECLDLGDSAIGPYMVMELLEGMSLGEFIKQEGKLAPELVCAIAREALLGLAAAHRAGIVHRDLTPGNVFLHQGAEGPPRIKLMDFGVSKFLDGEAESETQHGALLGTPEYMSPEQVSGAKDVDVRTDIWAMGAILYRALTGEDAFQGPTVGARLVAVSLDDTPNVLDKNPEVPAALAALVSKCLSRDLDARYQTADELRDALAPFAGEGPIPRLVMDVQPPVTDSAATLAVTAADAETVFFDENPAAPAVPAVDRSFVWWGGIGLGVVAVGVVAMALLGTPETDPEVEVHTGVETSAEPDPNADANDAPTREEDGASREARKQKRRGKTGAGKQDDEVRGRGGPLPSLEDLAEAPDETDGAPAPAGEPPIPAEDEQDTGKAPTLVPDPPAMDTSNPAPP